MFKNIFRFYLYNLISLIFYATFNLALNFDLILGCFGAFLGPNGLLLGLGSGSNTVFGSTNVEEHLLFPIVPSILTFDFALILGSFLHFLDPNAQFLELG